MLLAQMQSMQLLMEQAALLKSAGEARVESGPSPKFQLLNRAEQVGYKPPAVSTNSGLLLWAALGQMSIGENPGTSGTSSNKVDVLHANQQQMHFHLLQFVQ